MKHVLTFFLLILYSYAYTQQRKTNKNKWKYFGLHQVGILVGNSAVNPGVLTTNGIYKNNWYTGISTGIDWYGTRSIPLLADVHKAFGKNRNQPFVYGNAGINFPWREHDENLYGYYGGSKVLKGFVAESGIGYFVSFKNQTALSLCAGFSYKSDGYKTFYTSGYNNETFTTSYKYYYRRIAIRIGLKI